MIKWSNPEEWERLRNAASCPVCLRGGSTDAIAELETSFLIASENGPMKGYCFLLYKRHVIELYELPAVEATAFMRDVQRAAKAVHEITHAVKLNYEIHGNTIPHLHLQLFPRYSGDQWLCLKTQRSFLETVSTGSGSDLVNEWSQKSLENIAC